MSTYTVKSGDNLWNICKREYNLKSNAEILKKVKEVAAANNMSINSTIFTGKTIQLEKESDPQPKQEVEIDKTATAPIKNTAQLAAQERIGFNSLNSYDDLNKLMTSSVSIFGSEVKTDEQKNQAYLDYSKELLSNYYDIDGDGKVTVDEFFLKEAKGSMQAMKLQGEHVDETTRKMLAEDPQMLALYDTTGDGEISQQEYDEGNKKLGVTSFESKGNDLNKTIAERSSNLFAQNLDFNGNGLIDPEELAFFNQNADAIDGAADGVIKNAGESDMFGAVTGQNASNPEYNRVVNKYLRGEDLTPAEYSTLIKCKREIKMNMGKAAGISIEG